MIIACLMALLSGASLIVSRSLNGLLAQETSPYSSTLMNYLTGSIASFVLVMMIEPYMIQAFNISDFYIRGTQFLGGVIGVFNIFILNKIVMKTSPVQLTFVIFLSQMISAMILDAIFLTTISFTKILGCVLVIIGMIISSFHHQ